MTEMLHWFQRDTWLMLGASGVTMVWLFILTRRRSLWMRWLTAEERFNRRLGIPEKYGQMSRRFSESKFYTRSVWVFLFAFLALALVSGWIDLRAKALSLYESGREKYFASKYAEAYHDLSLSIKLESDFAPAYCFRGAVKNQLGYFSSAAADCTKAIKLDPKYGAAYNTRGQAKVSMGDSTGAISDTEFAIGLNASNAAAYNTRGMAKSFLGEKQSAILDFNKAIEINPNN